MATQNRKFTKILLAGLFVGGAVAFGYACGGDDTTGPTGGVPMAGSSGAGGTASPTGTGGGGAANTGGDGTGGATGGNAGAGTGGGDGGVVAMPCQASGTFDNVKAKTVFPTDGGVPAL